MVTQVDKVVDALVKFLPKRPLHHHEPFYNKYDALDHISCALDEPLFLQNHWVFEFEDTLRKIVGVDQCIALNSGTSALHVALLALGVGLGDEVLLPSLTFIGTANAIVYCGATPRFLDCSLSLSPDSVEEYLKNNPTPKAIILVHLLGHPADAEGVCKVASKYNVPVIEDCAQALGSYIHGRHVGTYGMFGCFSFNNNKIVTTNGGGALVTNDPNLILKAYDLANTARIAHPWLIQHSSVAYNYRMGSVNAALGLSQLDKFEEILLYKKRLSYKYREVLDDVVYFVEPICGTQSNYWLNTIFVDKRDEILTKLHEKKIYARALNTPLTELKIFDGKMSGPQISSINMFKHAICLPSGANLV